MVKTKRTAMTLALGLLLVLFSTAFAAMPAQPRMSRTASSPTTPQQPQLGWSGWGQVPGVKANLLLTHFGNFKWTHPYCERKHCSLRRACNRTDLFSNGGAKCTI